MINPWIQAFRLKTLPLALSNTIMGSALAVLDGGFRWSVFVLAALTTVFLQIISNMANDYGDFINGKDTEERIGPKRMVQSGEISAKAMLRGIIILSVLTAFTGLALILVGTAGIDITNILIFAVLGIASIVAALKYTVGKNPYGYRGLGDIFVFVFFGLVGVMGTYFLHTQTLSWEIILPASAIGLLSTAVLNMNNMRDYEADKNAGKQTIVVKMGIPKARIYHLVLISGAFTALGIFGIIRFESIWQWLFLLSTPLFAVNLKKVFTFNQGKELFPELARVSMGTLIFTLLFLIGILL
ncbi:MAG: 1,4-dihydroxy-2-naphthoate polyprenyltransferase [Paludibacter sp.]|nr:1,4-dihydroxy-2-naphthoate polyprenyltransferase [Paludibacter sp.]